MKKRNGKIFLYVMGVLAFSLLAGCSKNVEPEGSVKEQRMPSPKTDALAAASAMPAPKPSQETEERSENEQAQEGYLQALLENDFEKTPDLCMAQPSRYAFYDIDGNGIDELLTGGGYFANAFYTYQDGEIVYLWHNKYGGNFKLYPEKGIIELPIGGHMDQYYQQFVSVRGTKGKRAAVKSWTVHHLSDTETETTYKYKLAGKRVTKEQYQQYVDRLKKNRVVRWKQLKWNKVSALRRGYEFTGKPVSHEGGEGEHE